MVQYKVMANNFSKSTCAQTKVVLKKGDMIYYVKSSDNPDIKDHRAYSPESQVAEWLKIHGQVIESKPVATPIQTAAPVMASMLHDDHPASLVAAVKPAVVAPKIHTTVTRYSNGTVVKTIVYNRS